jgi:hypothetical protein
MNDIQKKAKLILAGLAVMPAMASAAQTNAYHCPYNVCDSEDVLDQSEQMLSQVTGLSVAELRAGKDMVRELNSLDVISVREVNLTQAPRISYHYNMPLPVDVQAARAKNLERLEKLRHIIEAAK